MRDPNAVKHQLVFGTIAAWGCLIARLGFNAYPNAMPTWGLFLMAVTVSVLLYFYSKIRDLSLAAVPNVSLKLKIFGTIGITCSATALAWYVVSHHGVVSHRGLGLVATVPLSGVFVLQWLTDKSQF